MSKILSKERLFAITSDWNKRRKICPKNGNNPHIWLDKGKVSTKAYNHRKRKESWEPFSMILTRSICKYCNWVKYQERDETGRFILGDEDWKKSYLKIENTVFLRAEDLSVDFKLFRSPQPLQEINLTKEDILEKVKIFTENYIYYPYGNGTVYVLHLKTGRCYVGWTSNYFKRKIVHANLPKSLWLKKYPVLAEICTIRNASLETEHQLADYLIRELGLGFIRGGAYTQRILNKNDIEYFLQYQEK